MQLNSRWTCQSIRIFDLRPSYISCIYCGNHSWSFEPVCGLTVIMHIFGSITNRSTFNNESLGETLTPVLRFQSPESVEYQKCRSKFLWTRRRLATIARRFCHLVRKHGKLVAFGKFVFWMKQMKIMKILWHLSLQSHTPNVNYSSNQTKKKIKTNNPIFNWFLWFIDCRFLHVKSMILAHLIRLRQRMWQLIIKKPVYTRIII